MNMHNSCLGAEEERAVDILRISETKKWAALQNNKSNKQKVRNVIEGKDTAFVPTRYTSFATETLLKYGVELADLMANYPDEIVLAYPFDPVIGYQPTINVQEHAATRTLNQFQWQDEWGAKFCSLSDSIGSNPVGHPLENWGMLANLRIPDPQQPGRFEAARKIVETNRAHYTLGDLHFALFERMHFLRGMDKLMMDMYLEPENVAQLTRKVCDYLLGMIEQWGNLSVDGIFLTDDWGTQDTLLIQPEIWRKLFKSYYKEIFDTIHKYDMHACLHSCGNVAAIIPDLIEIGLDILHSIQPAAMDYRQLAKKFGRDICFYGGIDTQYLLTQGTPSEIKQEIQDLVSTFRAEKAALILSPANTIMPETPFENIVAMCKACHENGLEP